MKYFSSETVKKLVQILGQFNYPFIFDEYTVEINLEATTAGQSKKFGDKAHLRDKLIYGIVVHDASNFAVSESGLAVIPAADLIKTSISLYDSSTAFFDQVPSSNFSKAQNGGMETVFKPRVINFDDSRVFVNQALSANNLAFVVTFLYVNETPDG